MRTFVTGVVGVVVTLAAFRAKAEPAGARVVVVLDGTELPHQVADAHQRLQTAVEGAVRAASWDVAAPAATPAPCDGTADCYRAAAGTSGAAVVIRLTGGRNINDGYDIDALMWRAADGSTKRIVGSCSFCVVDDMTRIARKLVRDLLVDADRPAAQPVPAAPPPEAPKATPLGTVQPSAGAAAPTRARLTAPIVVGAAGVAILAAGFSLWVLDGHSNGNCSAATASPSFCDSYKTQTLGEVLTGVGAVTMGVSGLLFWRAQEAVSTPRVAVGPGTVSILGRF